jgi:surfactin synthase thioesterase subunit
VKTLTEPVSYKNPLAKKLNVTYVAFIPPGVSKAERTKDPSWHRAEKRNWTIKTFDGDHVIYRSKPAEFSEFLEDTVKDTNKH